MKLQRHPASPILKPNPLHPWESLNVFNPGAIYHDGLFHLFYRAQGADYVSHIGYALSEDGVQFNRLEQPVLSPVGEWETRGVEDPRITYLADEQRFVMAYTAFAPPRRITPMFAESTNLVTWRRLGALVTGEDNKDHVLFPRKINGRYASFHRRPPSIWIAYSDDLVQWDDFQVVMAPRPASWACKRVGGGGVPIETEHGWLVLYHAYDDLHVYRLGVALLDLDDPTHVLHRPAGAIFEPEETWELKGDTPNVVFSAANPVVAGTVYVYYGGADRVIGLATVDFNELVAYALSEPANDQEVS